MAKDYLEHVGFTDIEWQPEGKGRFPDFRVDQTIGIEVRALNRNFVGPNDELIDQTQGARAVSQRVRNLLPTLGPPLQGSWFVRSHFNRPLPKWNKLRKALERHLLAFKLNPQDKATLQIDPGFSLELFRASNSHAHFFIDGAYDDLDNGAYFVDSERLRNLQLCIREKTEKRRNAKLTRTYSEWWLIFDDRIGFGFAFEYPEQVRIKANDWDRVILLSPEGAHIACEVPLIHFSQSP